MNYFTITFAIRSSIVVAIDLESLSAHPFSGLGVVGKKGCVTASSSKGHRPPLGFQFEAEQNVFDDYTKA